MGGPRPAQPVAGDGPAGGEALLILLAEPAGEVERALVKRWLDEADVRPSVLLPLDGPGLARSLAGRRPIRSSPPRAWRGCRASGTASGGSAGQTSCRR